MTTLNEMVSKAYSAKKVGNYMLRDTATMAGYNVNDEASSQAYLDAMTAQALEGINSWDGRPLTREQQQANPKHPVLIAMNNLTWLVAIGATKQADAIKAAATAARAH